MNTDYQGVAVLITAIAGAIAVVVNAVMSIINYSINSKTHDLVNGFSTKNDALIAKSSYAEGVKSETDKNL